MKQDLIRWLDEPQDHDYPAARSYLTLVIKPAEAKAAVAKLKKATIGSMPRCRAKSGY